MSNDAVTAQGRQSTLGAAIVHGTYLEQAVFLVLGPIFLGKVYPTIAPDNSVDPYAIQMIVSSIPSVTVDGQYILTNVLLQLDIYANSRLIARDLASRSAAALIGMANGTLGVTLQSSQSLYEDEVRLHRSMQEYRFLLPAAGGIA